MSRAVHCAMVGALMFAMAWVAGAGSASAAPTECASSPTYGVGIAIIPQFAGTSNLAVTAYPGEVLDYNVTLFLREDPPGTPSGVTVCAISGATLTVRLPNGAGPFTIATGVSLPAGGSVTFAHVPNQKYRMSTADVVDSPGCSSGATCYDRVQATAHVDATSEGPDDGPQDDEAVEATASAPTFLLAPSTQLTLSPSSSTITAGESVQWTVAETNDTPARYFPMTLSNAHVDLSTDGGASAFARLDATSANFSGDDGDGQLGAGETWKWTFTTTPAADSTLTATGFGTGARGRVITFPADAQERAVSAVVVIPPTTPPTTSPPPTAPPTTAPPPTSPPPTSPPPTSPPPTSPAPTPPPATAPPDTTPLAAVSPVAPETAPPTTPVALVAPTDQVLPATGIPSSSAALLIIGTISIAGGFTLWTISRRRRASRPIR